MLRGGNISTGVCLSTGGGGLVVGYLWYQVPSWSLALCPFHWTISFLGGRYLWSHVPSGRYTPGYPSRLPQIPYPLGYPSPLDTLPLGYPTLSGYLPRERTWDQRYPTPSSPEVTLTLPSCVIQTTWLSIHQSWPLEFYSSFPLIHKVGNVVILHCFVVKGQFWAKS